MCIKRERQKLADTVAKVVFALVLKNSAGCKRDFGVM
jgi:hypothetical protein